MFKTAALGFPNLSIILKIDLIRAIRNIFGTCTSHCKFSINPVFRMIRR